MARDKERDLHTGAMVTDNSWQRGPTILAQSCFFFGKGDRDWFDRTKDCGHPILNVLWHILIDQWRLARDQHITTAHYSQILGILARAYAEVYSESVNECVQQEQWTL